MINWARPAPSPIFIEQFVIDINTTKLLGDHEKIYLRKKIKYINHAKK